MPFRAETVRKGVYVELVRSLYSTLIPTTIMSVGYVLSFGVIAFELDTLAFQFLTFIGILSGAARAAVLLWGRADAKADTLDIGRARVLERNFAVVYYQFAVLLGASTAYVFLTLQPARFHMVMVCLLVGYGAGVVAGVGLRPWIAVPSMMAAIVPGIIAAALHRDPIYWVTAAIMTALLGGGIQSMFRRYRAASTEITKRMTFEALARRDVLTTLPNRLALRDWFDSHVAVASNQQLLAVHCLDLDNFKPVNDVFGHPVGDSLLKEVAARLMQTLPAGDIVARLGGDEFAIIQRNIRNPHEAAALARHLRMAIAEPISIKGHEISVSTSIGYTVCRRALADLEELLAVADQALYRAKNTGAGIECHDLPAKGVGLLAA